MSLSGKTCPLRHPTVPGKLPSRRDDPCSHRPPRRAEALGSFASCLRDLQKATVNLRAGRGEEERSLQIEM